MGIDIVTMSAKGQITLPTDMRRKLSVSGGDRLAVYATDEVIVLRPLRMPTEAQFSEWLNEAQAWAKDAGYGKEDLAGILRAVRRRKTT